MPTLTALLTVIVLSSVQVVLLFVLVRRARRTGRAVRSVGIVSESAGIVPKRVIDAHRRIADWASTEDTMLLPVVTDEPPRKPPRHRRRRKPPVVVPGVDADVIEMSRRLSQKIRGEEDGGGRDAS